MRFIALTAAVILMLYAPMSAACSCSHRDLLQEVDEVRNIVKIEILNSTSNVGEIRVLKTYKGQMPSTMKVRLGVGGVCSSFVKPGIYLWLNDFQEEQIHQPLTFGLCAPLIEFDERLHVLSWMKLSPTERQRRLSNPDLYCENNYGRRAKIVVDESRVSTHNYRGSRITGPMSFDCERKISKSEPRCPNGMERNDNRNACEARANDIELICGSKLLKRWPDLSKENCEKRKAEQR